MEALRIGRAFRALRIRKRWRQQDLAEDVHVSRQLIARIESGRIDDVGESTTARRRVQLLAATYQSAFPVRGASVSAWLRRPVGP